MKVSFKVAVAEGDKIVSVIVGSVVSAAKIASHNLVKGRGVLINPTKADPTHKTSQSAISSVEVGLMLWAVPELTKHVVHTEHRAAR